MRLRKIILIAAAICVVSICANAAEDIPSEEVYVRNTNDGINVWINGDYLTFMIGGKEYTALPDDPKSGFVICYDLIL